MLSPRRSREEVVMTMLQVESKVKEQYERFRRELPIM